MLMTLSCCVVQTPSEAIWNQSDGWADTERHHSVLCLCDRKTESALSQHTVLKGKRTFPPTSASRFNWYFANLLFVLLESFFGVLHLSYCILKPLWMICSHLGKKLFHFLSFNCVYLISLFPSSKSTSLSSSVTPLKGWSSLPRRSHSLAILAFTSMPRWCRSASEGSYIIQKLLRIIYLLFSNECCSFELSEQKKMYPGFHKNTKQNNSFQQWN